MSFFVSRYRPQAAQGYQPSNEGMRKMDLVLGAFGSCDLLKGRGSFTEIRLRLAKASL